MSDPWNRCDVCGKFIALEDITDGKATHTLLEPDSELGKETWETLCPTHAREDCFYYTDSCFKPGHKHDHGR